MNYEILVQSVSEIINNDLINKVGLSLVYKLDAKLHGKLSEHFYYKLNGDDNNYEYTEEFEVELGGILIKFIINED